MNDNKLNKVDGVVSFPEYTTYLQLTERKEKLKQIEKDIKEFIYSYIYGREYPRLPIYWESHETENEIYTFVPVEGKSIWNCLKMHKSKSQIEGELIYMPYIPVNSTPTIINGIFQKYALPNANGRIYSEETLKREVEKYQQRIKEHRAYGELNHPEYLTFTVTENK